MNRLLSIVILSFFLAMGCDVDNPLNPDPVIPAGTDTTTVHTCVLEKIQYLEARGVEADTVSISQFYYHGQIVYLYGAECCDRYNALYDSSCRLICLPTGGFVGTGDGSCPGFADSAIFIKHVWSKY